LRISLY